MKTAILLVLVVAAFAAEKNWKDETVADCELVGAFSGLIYTEASVAAMKCDNNLAAMDLIFQGIIDQMKIKCSGKGALEGGMAALNKYNTAIKNRVTALKCDTCLKIFPETCPKKRILSTNLFEHLERFNAVEELREPLAQLKAFGRQLAEADRLLAYTCPASKIATESGKKCTDDYMSIAQSGLMFNRCTTELKAYAEKCDKDHQPVLNVTKIDQDFQCDYEQHTAQWKLDNCDTVTGMTVDAVYSKYGVPKSWADLAGNLWSVGFGMIMALVMVFMK